MVSGYTRVWRGGGGWYMRVWGLESRQRDEFRFGFGIDMLWTCDDSALDRALVIPRVVSTRLLND